MELLLALTLCQDGAAILGKIQETIESAKTVQVAFSGEAVTRKGGRAQVYSGALLIKEGNILSLSLKSPDGGKETAVFSDGTRMRSRSSVGLTPERPADKSLEGRYRSGLVQVGVFASNPLLMLAQAAPGAKVFEILEVVPGRDGEGTFITYKFKVAGWEDAGTIKAWYDARTWKLLKRTGNISIAAAGIDISFTEIYDSCSLNADIPDARFTLPQS